MANRSSTNKEIVLKPSMYTRTPMLDPITEEPSVPEIDKPPSRRYSLRLDSNPVSRNRSFKICPFTQTECPEKKEKVNTSDTTSYDGYSMYSDMSEISTFTAYKDYSSLLDKPFIFRNADSLQRAVQNEAMMLEEYLKRMAAEAAVEEAPTPAPRSVAASSETVIDRITLDTKSQTETAETSSYRSSGDRKLKYLLGITADGENEEGTKDDLDKVVVDELLEKSLTGETQAMKQAQRYLRVHRIFEFYQFLVAHLLSALPENPINFILSLLDRCVVYRAGIGSPPLLYDRKHLEALFNLMDRMRTGYIDKNQYVTGMKTLGICSYNPDPPTNEEDMVHRSFFIEEAYENLVSMLNDIIRRRWIYFNNQPMPTTTPPPTPQFSTRSGRTNTSSRKK